MSDKSSTTNSKKALEKQLDDESRHVRFTETARMPTARITEPMSEAPRRSEAFDFWDTFAGGRSGTPSSMIASKTPSQAPRVARLSLSEVGDIWDAFSGDQSATAPSSIASKRPSPTPRAAKVKRSKADDVRKAPTERSPAPTDLAPEPTQPSSTPSPTLMEVDIGPPVPRPVKSAAKCESSVHKDAKRKSVRHKATGASRAGGNSAPSGDFAPTASFALPNDSKRDRTTAASSSTSHPSCVAPSKAPFMSQPADGFAFDEDTAAADVPAAPRVGPPKAKGKTLAKEGDDANVGNDRSPDLSSVPAVEKQRLRDGLVQAKVRFQRDRAVRDGMVEQVATLEESARQSHQSAIDITALLSQATLGAPRPNWGAEERTRRFQRNLHRAYMPFRAAQDAALEEILELTADVEEMDDALAGLDDVEAGLLELVEDLHNRIQGGR
ncbi:hypothetical protein OF83DRAFT_1178579 [Amylostereum chailletii]|nr:hypothetical protein OF83DRAFT_1178579 [Amylostereum chailletii]